MKKTLRSLLTASLLSFLFLQNIAGQNEPAFHCASDEMMAARPLLLERQSQLEEQLLKMPVAEKVFTPPYTLPVVVHIVHENGAENISDDQVFRAIEWLNDAFAHQNHYADLGDGFDTKIQFCLAKRDPDGNATNGITRTVSPWTVMDMIANDEALKNLSRWPTTDYINVWVVKAINSTSLGNGVVGYAYLASAHGQPYDGIVCEAGYFGTNPTDNAVLIHEMGHYLNLYHTFQNGCPNNDCLTNGDRVCDTPPDQVTFSACGFNSCSTDTDDASANNPLTADVADHTENYMDYSPFACYHAFTEGQTNRMHDAIEFARSSLLESQGCLDPCTLPITVDFVVSPPEIFAGQAINFTNLTTGATTYEWQVNGAVFSNDVDASYLFNDIGVFEVELLANNSDLNCLTSKSIFINVKCPVVAGFAPSETELEVGEVFTAVNTSENANEYEWWINGVLVDNSVDLGYSFSNEGDYVVLLNAFSEQCSDSHSLFVRVEDGSPCKDSITGYFYEAVGPNSYYLGVGDIHPSGEFFLKNYLPWQAGIITKFSENGLPMWDKKIDIPVNGINGNFHATADGGCVASFQSNTVGKRNLFKTNANGQTEWVKQIDPMDQLGSVIFDDGVIVFSARINDKCKAARLDNFGNVVWNKEFILSDDLYFFNSHLSEDGQFVWICGHNRTTNPSAATLMKLGLDGTLYFIKQYIEAEENPFEFRHVAATPDNGFVAAGKVSKPDNSDFTICKGDADGNIIWSKSINADSIGSFFEIAVWLFTNPNGEIWAGYRSAAPNRLAWISFSPDGEILFTKEFLTEDGQKVWIEPQGLINGKVMGRFQEWAWIDRLSLVQMNDDGTLEMGCILQNDVPIESTDYLLTPSDYTFTLGGPGITITNGTINYLPVEEQISLNPYCIDTLDCIELCHNGLDDDQDGYTDCFDPDCDCYPENCTVQLPPNDSIGAKIAWQTEGQLISSLSLPIVANLDPQNGPMPEIIVSQGSTVPGSGNVKDLLIYQGDGSNADQPARLPYLFDHFGHDNTPAVGDINGDGVIELVLNARYNGETRIMVFTDYNPTQNPPMRLLAEAIKPNDFTDDKPTLADLDQDGISEIITRNEIYRFDFSDPLSPALNLVLTGSGFGGEHGIATAQPAIADILRPSDCNGDPDCDGLELIAGIHIYSVDLDPFDGDGLEIKIQRDLNTMQGTILGDGFTYTADVNLDGVLDIVVAELIKSEEVGVYAWDKNGLLFQHRLMNPYWRIRGLTINNVFDDKTQGFAQDFPEIVFSTRHELVALNLNRATVAPTDPYWWKISHSSPSDAVPSTFDLNGDGMAEIIYKNSEEFRVFYGGPAPFPQGVDSERNYFKTACFAVTRDQSPTIADVDNDGEAEIITTGSATDFGLNDYRRQLWVFESDGLPWMPARPLWNQYGYFGLNVNDDGSIPRQPQLHHLEFPGLGSGKHPFNIATAQMPVLNSDFDPYILATDVVVQVDSTQCATDSMAVWLTVCNHGQRAIPDSLPVSIYQNDPTAGSAVLLKTVWVNELLEADSCLRFSLKMPSVFNTPIFVFGNDNGSQPTPFNPSTDFPNTHILECDFANNMVFFEMPYQPPTLNLGPDISICNSSTFTLNAGNGFVKYRWQDGSEDAIFTAYTPGLYWLDAWDACGFQHTDSVRISLNEADAIDLGPDQSICGDESVELSLSGYSNVHWWPADGLSCTDCPTVTASPDVPTTYYATASNGSCFSTDSIRIGVEVALQVSLSLTSLSCHGDTDGQAAAVPLNGQPPYSFLWENGQTDSLLTGIGTEPHAVTITDARGCTKTVSFHLLEPDPLVLTPVSTPVQCFGEMSGTATIEVDGGTPIYSYLWETGHNTPTVNGLAAGMYQVTITDFNGCKDTAVVEVTTPTLLEASATAERDSLCPDETTNLSASANGGTAPYSYLWNGTQTDSFWLNVPTGTYGLLVTDANGCTKMQTVGIGQLSPPISILDTTLATTGMANADGAVFINEILGGTPPFAFEWSNGDTAQSIENLLPGIYSLTITDAAGCVFTKEFEVGIMVAVEDGRVDGFIVTLFPNPSTGGEMANILIQSPVTQSIEVKLFDITGRLLWTEHWRHTGSAESFHISAPNAAGVYVLKVGGVYLRWVVTE